MRSLLRDARFAVRSLRRRANFTVVALAILTLGVGASTSVYSVVDGILFRPLPFPEPERLTAVSLTYPHWKKEPLLARSWDRISLSLPEYREWRARQHAFDDVAIWGTTVRTVGDGETRERLTIVVSTASMLDVLGVHPYLGRFFNAEEDAVGGPLVTVLSYEAWESRFARDPRVLGQLVRFDDVPRTIIGVLPRGISLNHGEPTTPFWFPLGQDSINARQPDNHSFLAIGRLKAGVTLAAATHEAAPLLTGAPGTQWRHGVRLQEWQKELTREVRKPMLFLLGAVLLLMLVACVNVAMLLLGEATAREQEIASRIALGANRWRIVRLLLVESAVLGTAGAALGAAAAWGGTKALVALAPANVPGIASVQVDLRVLGFAVLLSLFTAMLFGMAPAIMLARKDPASVLRSGRGLSGRRAGALQPLLVAAELALSFVLLVSAAMLSRSLLKVTAVDPGFRVDGLTALRVSVPRAKARDTLFLSSFYERLSRQIEGIPGVTAVTATTTSPFSGNSSSSGFEKEGEERIISERREAQQRVVLPGFFHVMGIELMAGRDFAAQDGPGAPRVVIVSEALAARDYPGQSPLGMRIRWQGEWREIVGVVADVKFAKLSRAFDPTIYAPQAQMRYSGLGVLVRAANPQAATLPALRTAVAAVDPDVIVLGSDRMPDLIRRSFAEERYRTTLIDFFGAMGVLLAAVGMYGVVSRAVGRRRRELGIRIALGAPARSVIVLVLSTTLVGLATGIALGVIGALATSRFIGAFLYDVPASDPLTYGGVALLLALVTLGASWIPARGASRTHPATVLRAE